MARKCTVCNTGDLIASGCGCLNPECHNYVEKWKPCVAGYKEDAKDPPKALPKAIPEELKELVHKAAQAKPDKDVDAWAEKLGNDISQEPPPKKKEAAPPPPKDQSKPRKIRVKPPVCFD